MAEQWQQWAWDATGDTDEPRTTCAWEIPLPGTPYRATECGTPLHGDDPLFCHLHDADAVDAGLITEAEHDAQHAHHQALTA